MLVLQYHVTQSLVLVSRLPMNRGWVLVERCGWSMAAVWPLSLVALIGGSLVLAYVMHIVIEKPSLRVRDRVAS